MRNFTVTCDRCGFQKSFEVGEFEPAVIKGWAYINIRGPYKDIELCPECLKSFLGISELEEETEDD